MLNSICCFEPLLFFNEILSFFSKGSFCYVINVSFGSNDRQKNLICDILKHIPDTVSSAQNSLVILIIKVVCLRVQMYYVNKLTSGQR